MYTYRRLCEEVIQGFKLISDVVAIASNLLAKRLHVEVGRNLEVITGCGYSAYLAQAELGRAPLMPILRLPCEVSQLKRRKQRCRPRLLHLQKEHASGGDLLWSSQHHTYQLLVDDLKNYYDSRRFDQNYN